MTLGSMGPERQGDGGNASRLPLRNVDEPESRPTPDFERVRSDFPRARSAAYLDNASIHPLSVRSVEAIQHIIDWETNEIAEPWWPTWAKPRDYCKELFARLIGAEPGEIAFARSTTEAENNILNGLHLLPPKGNVVTTDLHFKYSLYNYKMRERSGLEVRVVKHRDWQLDLGDLERAVDDETALVAIPVVSNVNGYVHDVGAISAIAHARGAYLYADIIQAAGAVPIDVKAMGIDMAACGTFKWLMGLTGFGFLYVRGDLQGSVVRPAQYEGDVEFNYPPWTESPDRNNQDIVFDPVVGPKQFEVSYPSFAGVACATESLGYILDIGVSSIRAHARELTERLQSELPAKGFRPITPANNESPIVAFVCQDPEGALRQLHSSNVHVAMRFGKMMRVSPSVYNNHDDLDRLVAALA
jgi:selenocysteine lyase/cysteine desulfurase